MAASRGDFAADSGSDLNSDVAETGAISGGILMNAAIRRIIVSQFGST